MRKHLVLTFVLAAMGVAQGSATAHSESNGIRPEKWRVGSVGPHKLTLGVLTGYCVGQPKPRIDHVARAWRRRSVVITVFLRYSEAHSGKNESCADLGIEISKQIKFKRSIADRALYDGSTSPPQRRWRPHR